MHRAVQRIKALSKPAGPAINSATPTSVLQELPHRQHHPVATARRYFDLILLQDVDLYSLSLWTPVSASAFITHHPVQDHTRPSDDQASWLQCKPEGDGGLDAKTARFAVGAGANILVAGTTIFGEGEGVDCPCNVCGPPSSNCGKNMIPADRHA